VNERTIGVRLARLLVESGRLDLLRAEADGGDWTCAQVLGDELARRGEWAAVEEVYRPFLGPDDGWGRAADRMTEVLEMSQGAEQAMAFVRPRAESGDRAAIRCWASLLGRHGRVDEMFAVLRPHLTDWWLAEVLVEATAGQGRDDDVVSELRALVAAVERHPDKWSAKPHNAAQLLAAVLERQGRRDEAITVLREIRWTSTSQIDDLTALMVSDGRESELRELVADEKRRRVARFGPGALGDPTAAKGLVTFLEERGRVAEAADVLRPFVDAGSINAARGLAYLLHRAGRVDEAVDVFLAAVRRERAMEPVTRAQLQSILIDEGRAEEALGYLDEWIREFDPDGVFHERVGLLHLCGRSEEALDLLRARRDADRYRVAEQTARILDDLGRTEEAIALLRAHPSRYVRFTLAMMLFRQGDVEEAVAAAR
jgi:tetratricopeptide (TPR) repeat protein